MAINTNRIYHNFGILSFSIFSARYLFFSSDDDNVQGGHLAAVLPGF